MGRSHGCWACHATIEIHSQVLGLPRAPRKGDPSVCGYCASFGIIDGPRLRKPTAAEVAHIRRQPALMLTHRALVDMLRSAVKFN